MGLLYARPALEPRTVFIPTWQCRLCGHHQDRLRIPSSCRCGASAFDEDGRCWQWAECPGVRTCATERVCSACHTSPFVLYRHRR
jgi:hypothetical protein